MYVVSLYTPCFVLLCVFCTGHFVMVPIKLTCPHCLQHFFFEHLFHYIVIYIRNLVFGKNNCFRKYLLYSMAGDKASDQLPD